MKIIEKEVISPLLASIKAEADRMGIPYQTYVGSILHRYTPGELIIRKES